MSKALPVPGDLPAIRKRFEEAIAQRVEVPMKYLLTDGLSRGAQRYRDIQRALAFIEKAAWTLNRLGGWRLKKPRDGFGMIRRSEPGFGEECPLTAIYRLRTNLRVSPDEWRKITFQLGLDESVAQEIVHSTDCSSARYSKRLREALLAACGLAPTAEE